ncbi:MAG TPA: GAF domain-containing sensor histidine kinase [Polyangiaceae bacterium]|nr:GAF domain-containing sensor histidine kinase [Polyangiaceae bacterium]
MLQHLLGLPALDLAAALTEACQRLAETLRCDKTDAFLLEESTQTLVAVGTSDTPLGRRQKALGLDRLPLANGGKVADAFQARRTYATGDQDYDVGELRGVVEALGVRSQIAAPLEVGGAVRGVLSVVSTTPRYFDAPDVGFVEAVSRWVGALAHRAELVEALRRADEQKGRRAAADEVVTVLAHDVRNHLNPLHGRLQLLRASAGRDGRDEDLLHADAALRSLTRLTRMTSDLLDINRLDRGLFVLYPAPLNLLALVRETAPTLATPSVDVSAEGSEDLVVVADADRLRQAIENVVGNAVKHSPPGRPVRVEVGPAEGGGEPRALIDVVDRGPGVPADLLPRLFQHFAAGAGSTGLGLGLYLARCIARAHGGSLQVESTSAEGTRFRFVLPLAGPPSPAALGVGYKGS